MFTERLRFAGLALAMTAIGCTAALSVEMEENNWNESSSGTSESKEEGATDPPEEKDPAPPEWAILFADPALAEAVLEGHDADRDGWLSEGEALAVEELIAPGSGISDLSGLERCHNLWKIDLRDNDIRDATILRELPRLHWLDLRGNKNLETFDVTGCSQYFDHCEFEVTDSLRYYTFRQQAGVTTASDPYCLHSVHLLDPRGSTDWSLHGRWHAVREHTLGDGIPIVFSGIGYLDVDIADGSFGRLMEDAMGLFFESYGTIAAYLDWFDVYYVDWILPDRNSGCVTWEEYVANGHDMIGIPSRDRLVEDQEELMRYCYESLTGKPSEGYFPELFVSVDCNPLAAGVYRAPRFLAEPDQVHFTDYRAHQFRFRYSTCAAASTGLEATTDETMYGCLNSTYGLEELMMSPEGWGGYDFQEAFLWFCWLTD